MIDKLIQAKPIWALFDAVQFGIPMILYEPKVSFIGWLALMIVISPVLQWLMMLAGAQLGLITNYELGITNEKKDV